MCLIQKHLYLEEPTFCTHFDIPKVGEIPNLGARVRQIPQKCKTGEQWRHEAGGYIVQHCGRRFKREISKLQ